MFIMDGGKKIVFGCRVTGGCFEPLCEDGFAEAQGWLEPSPRTMSGNRNLRLRQNNTTMPFNRRSMLNSMQLDQSSRGFG